MTPWARIEATDPIFRKCGRRGCREPRTYLLGSSWYVIRRYVIPTVAWMELLPPHDQFALHMEDRRTPFIRMVKPSEDE